MYPIAQPRLCCIFRSVPRPIRCSCVLPSNRREVVDAQQLTAVDSDVRHRTPRAVSSRRTSGTPNIRRYLDIPPGGIGSMTASALH
jgi:hypothetical protein